MCLCLSESGSEGGSPTKATVRLDHLEADGSVINSWDVATLEGHADPRDAGRIPTDRPPNVATAMSFSEGDAFGFVGWSRRADTRWESGVLVVDLVTGSVVSDVSLPSDTSGEGTARRVVEAPRVVSSTGEDELVIGRSWYEFAPTYSFGTEAFRASFTSGSVGEPAAVPGMADCGDTVRFGGQLADGGTWVVCTRGGAFEATLRRVAGDGSTLPDVRVSGEMGIEGDATALSRDRSAVFAWDPASATLTRIEIATGDKTSGEGLTARLDAGPLAALGRWLAPVAAAKSMLRSSVVVSRDGSRVYAIGVKDSLENPDIKGSAGVFVFDAATLQLVDIYQPTADFVSLAASFDGRFVYATGLPGFDARGRRDLDQGASITVFDTSDGSTRLIAGQLGSGRLTFGPEPLG